LPNVFIDRSSSDPSQRAAIARLAANVGAAGGVVLFPEGTFHTAERAERAQARLRERDQERSERLATLRHVLPPRPGGVLAALEGDPTADVHVIAHVGFEGMATMAELVGSVPLDQPVDVEIWRVARADIPTERHEQVRWLDDLWLRLDDWVDNAGRRRRGCAP
ncbi:MAG: acyltransferase, partial [Acidimicrobiia bacterium]|nr:acyltransferase [Acidimicrobiia bacterium]